MSDEAAPEWEACKENVLPIKRGRSAKGLSESLSKAISTDTSIDKLREKVFEDALSAAATKSPKELLDSYVTYFKWIRDTYPKGTEQAIKILEVSSLYCGSSGIFVKTCVYLFP
jgi:checkpoint serine/threonine-protein kinase